MSGAIADEMRLFIHAILTGVILSVIYDGFRILRRVKKHGWLWIAIEDFFYWMGCALYIFNVLMRDNNGVIRWFFIIGIFLGTGIYELTISHYIVAILSKVTGVLAGLVRKVLAVLWTPFRLLRKGTCKMLEMGSPWAKKLKKALKKTYKTVRIGLSKK